MTTYFPEPIKVPIVDQEDRIAALLSVSNYGAFQKSIVVDSEGGSTPRGLIEPRYVTGLQGRILSQLGK